MPFKCNGIFLFYMNWFVVEVVGGCKWQDNSLCGLAPAHVNGARRSSMLHVPSNFYYLFQRSMPMFFRVDLFGLLLACGCDERCARGVLWHIFAIE